MPLFRQCKCAGILGRDIRIWRTYDSTYTQEQKQLNDLKNRYSNTMSSQKMEAKFDCFLKSIEFLGKSSSKSDVCLIVNTLSL